MKKVNKNTWQLIGRVIIRVLTIIINSRTHEKKKDNEKRLP